MREVERAGDVLYLIGHDPRTGRPRLGPRQLGLGLAAALIGELLIGRLVELHDDVLLATARQPVLRRVRHYYHGLAIMGWCGESYRALPPDRTEQPCRWCGITGTEVFPDRLAWDTRELIAREHTPRAVQDWLTVLAVDTTERVAQRLAAEGWLLARDRRGLWSGRATRTWVPTNMIEADSPRQALSRVARGLDPHPTTPQRLVTALADTLALTRVLLHDVPDPDTATRTLNATTTGLHQPLRLLVEQTKAAADNVVTTHTS